MSPFQAAVEFMSSSRALGLLLERGVLGSPASTSNSSPSFDPLGTLCAKPQLWSVVEGDREWRARVEKCALLLAHDAEIPPNSRSSNYAHALLDRAFDVRAHMEAWAEERRVRLQWCLDHITRLPKAAWPLVEGYAALPARKLLVSVQRQDERWWRSEILTPLRAHERYDSPN
jgi:hypothetical protein